jgi:hypothetical protein
VASKQTTWQRGAPSYQRRGSPDEQALYQTGVSEVGAENVVANRNAWAVRCQVESSMAARRSLLKQRALEFRLGPTRVSPSQLLERSTFAEVAPMKRVTNDLRDAVRTVRRRPGTTVVAVLMLSLGIGGATTIFSVVDAVLLRPLPYLDADRLVMIWQSDRTRSQPFLEISYPAFREWRERTRAFELIAAMPSVNFEMALTERGEPVAIEGRAVIPASCKRGTSSGD